MSKGSRLRRMAQEEWDNAVDALERDYLGGDLSDEGAKLKLKELFGNDDHWWILFDMRKHGIPYGS